MGEELKPGWRALAQPAVRVQFDQHLERVPQVIRDSEALVDRAVPTSRLVLLAGHAYDTRRQALREGWRPPRHESDWTGEEWYGLRLLACYELASREPRGPRPARRHGDWFSIVGLIRGSRPG